jgi:hypothetical protein
MRLSSGQEKTRPGLDRGSTTYTPSVLARTHARQGVACFGASTRSFTTGRPAGAGRPIHRRRRPEQQIQRAVIEHLKLRPVPGIFWFHVGNGGYRTPIEARVFKSLGVTAGVPDLILIREGKTYGLELKAVGGRLTPVQETAHVLMRAAGAEVAVAIGLDAALRQLERWGMLQGRVQ